MKKTLFLLVVIGLSGSVVARADGPGATPKAKKASKTASVSPAREHIYITNVVVTGSHIPLVVTRYGKKVTAANASFIAYSQPQFDQTGQLNVAAELNQLDPAISSVGSRR